MAAYCSRGAMCGTARCSLPLDVCEAAGVEHCGQPVLLRVLPRAPNGPVCDRGPLWLLCTCWPLAAAAQPASVDATVVVPEPLISPWHGIDNQQSFEPGQEQTQEEEDRKHAHCERRRRRGLAAAAVPVPPLPASWWTPLLVSDVYPLPAALMLTSIQVFVEHSDGGAGGVSTELVCSVLADKPVCAPCRLQLRQRTSNAAHDTQETAVEAWAGVSAIVVVETLPPTGARLPGIITASTAITILPALPATANEHDNTPPEAHAQNRAGPSIAGLDKELADLTALIRLPLEYPMVFSRLGIECPSGILLCGPPGTGKTLLARVAAATCGAELIVVHGSEILGSYLGESETNLRDVFGKARDIAAQRACILFMDEIDALCPKRDNAHSHESRVVAQLLTLMDGLTHRGKLVVIGATNRPDSLDPALRRPGRFDREIFMNPPTATQRVAILQQYLRNLPLSNTVSVTSLAQRCIGFVGADLSALCREAGLLALRRQAADPRDVGNALQTPLAVTQADFELAMARVIPSVNRASHVDMDPVSWDDVGGLASTKLLLKQAVQWPLEHASTFTRLGVSPPKGVLLHGPPGCSKTTLVKAIATGCHATFLTLNGAQLYSPFVGDSERTLRDVFRQARAAAPAVLFLDEVDALVGRRQSGSEGGNKAQERVLSTLLNEMDGIEGTSGVLVVAATNRLDALDAAFLRPGRIDHILHIPLPDETSRLEILRVHSRHLCIGDDVDLAMFARNTPGCSGAELENLCREAALRALRDSIEATRVHRQHFEAALASVVPNVMPTAPCP
eukprot:m.227460 g.227460  ORF g.227460 m.227460 type:complete len:794 (-) comp18815_c0_seq2:96-2477(-)